MVMPGRGFSSDRYRFGFNGKEKDDELKGSGNSYDFDARIYDPRLGRWLSCDPLAIKYPFASPYNFALNTPIQAVDPDGKVVVFINGNHYGDGGKAKYWRQYKEGKETYAFDKEAMKQFKDYKAVYKDGAVGGWAPFNGMDAQSRRNEGFWAGQNEAKALLDNLDADETIKIVPSLTATATLTLCNPRQ
jgi:RHS repeat-associated protein